MRYAIFYELYADGQFDEERRPLGFIVPDSNVTIVIGDDGVDDG